MMSIAAIIKITSFLGLLLLCAYIYLVIIKIRNTKIKHKKQSWIDQHQGEIEAYFLHGDIEKVTFRPTKPYHFSALEDFFSLYLTNYKVDKANDPIKRFIEHFFLDDYRKRLKNPVWSVRMNTLYFLDLFQIEEMQNDLLDHLNSKDLTNEEEYQIYILLASLGYDRLYELFKESKGLPPFLLNVMLNRLVHEENIDDYIDNFYQFQLSWQLSLLDLIRNKNLRSWKIVNFLEGLLHTEDMELRIRALKTFAHIGYVSSSQVISKWYEENSNREDWLSDAATGERLIFARLLGMIKDESFLPLLEELITDTKYNVRAEAAKSIRKYKNGKNKLQEIAANHSDKYSRNIAMEWVERSLDYE
jgi:hypothetical protein